MTSHGILWVTTVIMLAGGGAILAMGKRRTPAEASLTIMHGVVPIIAACLYFAMATGQGLVALPTDQAVAAGTPGPLRIFYFGRYIDWMFTTPLLLASLALTATRSGPKRPDLILGAVLADVMMILTSFAYSASEVGWIKWTWFLTSCVAFLAVYYVIWGPQAQANAGQRADVRAGYQRNASILSVLWLAYPIVLALAPDGLHVLGDAASVLIIAVLDVLAKVVYGVMATVADTRIGDRDLNETPAGARVTV